MGTCQTASRPSPRSPSIHNDSAPPDMGTGHFEKSVSGIGGAPIHTGYSGAEFADSPAAMNGTCTQRPIKNIQMLPYRALMGPGGMLWTWIPSLPEGPGLRHENHPLVLIVVRPPRDLGTGTSTGCHKCRTVRMRSLRYNASAVRCNTFDVFSISADGQESSW